MFDLPAWDWNLFSLINQHWRNPLFDWLMPLLSSAGLLWILGAGLLVLALVLRSRKLLVFILFAALLVGSTDLGTNLVKHAIGRVRPYKSQAGVFYHRDDAWRQRPETYQPEKRNGRSYPSAHAANTMALAVAVVLLWPGSRARFVALLLPLAVGYSRIYLGKHYPTDVFAGWSLGAVTAGVLIVLPCHFSSLFRRVVYGRQNDSNHSCASGTGTTPTIPREEREPH